MNKYCYKVDQNAYSEVIYLFHIPLKDQYTNVVSNMTWIF